MTKAHILAKNNTVNINIPILKSNIDEERRIVSGWATIDNLDQTGDIVTAEASLRAFERFRGNVREQHDVSKAVGRVVSFRQQEYFDKSGKSHIGIWVDVYVSKGAQDTWEKVLDGTLSAFSIGGAYSDSGVVREYIPDFNKMAQIIIDYNLIELSLVDNPGNELCDVVYVQKMNAEECENTIAIQNVFWCNDDELALASSRELIKCNTCGTDMNRIGWFEDINHDTAVEQIKKILDSNRSEVNATKGGSEIMTENQQQVTAETAPVEEAPVTEEVTEVKEVEEVKETSVEAPEVEAAVEPDLAVVTKALSEIQESLQRATASEEERQAALNKVREAVEGVEAKVANQLEKLLEEHNKLVSDVNSLKEGVQGFEKRLENVEGSTAFQKSLNIEGVSAPAPTNQSGFWGGSFIE